MNYWILFITIALASWLVSALMQQRFKKYSKVYIPLTGKQVAEKMLRDNGIYDVQVVSTPGHLTDHYDPRTKTVNLSDSVYNSNSVAAAAVAAHECGHAIQYAEEYKPIVFRNAIVKSTNFCSRISFLLIFGS